MFNIIYIFINIIIDKYFNNYNYFYILNLVNKINQFYNTYIYNNYIIV